MKVKQIQAERETEKSEADSYAFEVERGVGKDGFYDRMVQD